MFTVLKVISRIAHMLSTTILSGSIILNYFFELNWYLRDSEDYRRLHMITGIVLIVSGILNIFLIKGGKKLKPEQKPWIHFFELKFVLALLLTPVINPLLWRLTTT